MCIIRLRKRKEIDVFNLEEKKKVEILISFIMSFWNNLYSEKYHVITLLGSEF